jgi:hypothetical protein
MPRCPVVRAHAVAARAQRHRRRLRREAARLHAALTTLETLDPASSPHDGGVRRPAPRPAVHADAVTAGWLAARDRLGALARLRADVAEALHHLRVLATSLDPPPA